MPKIITTPFGQVDIEYKVTKHLVKSTPYNTTLKAEWIGFEYLRIDLKEATVLWQVSHYDSTGNKIEDTSLSTNIVRSYISNNNKVTKDGVTITHESFPPIEKPDGTFDTSAYDSAYSAGYPEFDYWLGVISKVPIVAALDGAAPILQKGGKLK